MLELIGGPKYNVGMDSAAASTARFGKAVEGAQKRSFLMNQTLFTARRALFYTSLGLFGVIGGVIKMGFEFNNALQGMKVALGPFFQGMPGVLDATINRLYKISTLSPFLFQDVTTAFRTMYPGFKALGISAKQTTDIMQALTNAMAVSGRVSGPQLQRAAIALQHMAFAGRLTGYAVNQLGRDGIPIAQVLSKYFGIAGDQLHNIGKLGIPAGLVLQKIVEYINTTPGFINAAARLSNSTLQGAWAQFKDMLSQASGRATGGLFSGLQTRLAKVNEYLQPFFKANKPITLELIAKAMDQSLTPKTHAVINAFYALQGAIQGLLGTFVVLTTVLSGIIRFFNFITFGLVTNKRAFHFLGIAIGINIAAWIMWKAVVGGTKGTIEIASLSIMLLRKGINMLSGAEGGKGLLLLIKRWREWATATKTMSTTKAYTGMANVITEFVNKGLLARLSRQILAAAAATRKWVIATWQQVSAQLALDSALWADPITWVIVAVAALTVGMVVLYFKWKKFHDFVNSKKGWIFAFIGPMAPVVLMLKTLQLLYNIIDKISRIARHTIVFHFKVHFPGSGILGFAAKHFIPGAAFATGLPNLLSHPFSPRAWARSLTGFAEGGTVTRPGWSVVGERGPEFRYEPARGSSIIPMHKLMNFKLHTETKQPIILEMDGRKVGEGVAKYVLRVQAAQ